MVDSQHCYPALCRRGIFLNQRTAFRLSPAARKIKPTETQVVVIQYRVACKFTESLRQIQGLAVVQIVATRVILDAFFGS
jgi:hypothetical protein